MRRRERAQTTEQDQLRLQQRRDQLSSESAEQREAKPQQMCTRQIEWLEQHQGEGNRHHSLWTIPQSKRRWEHFMLRLAPLYALHHTSNICTWCISDTRSAVVLAQRTLDLACASRHLTCSSHEHACVNSEHLVEGFRTSLYVAAVQGM